MLFPLRHALTGCGVGGGYRCGLFVIDLCMGIFITELMNRSFFNNLFT